ncbi:MAG: hypothetical protein AAGD38_22145, partial [Acidobacteriota bacterium]
DAAARLNRIVVAALLDAGVPAVSLPPSSWLTLDDGEAVEADLAPLRAALDHGLLPVVYGDVVVDRRRGWAIASTETVFSALVSFLPEPPAELLWLGETQGILDQEGRTVDLVTPRSIGRARTLIGATAGTDVTGGMLLRLDTSYQLAERGVPSRIIDGRARAALERVLLGETVAGTRVTNQVFE